MMRISLTRLLIFLLFLLSNGRIASSIKSDHSDSANLLNRPDLFLQRRQRCFSDQPESLLPNDRVFDTNKDSERDETVSLRRHDLSRCPANAVDALNDLSTLPSQSDLNTLLNISDSKNQTDVETDEFSTIPPRAEFNVQEIDDSTGPGSKTENKKSETLSQENVEKPAERPETPPPIATFEEWTKEKLKKPILKEGQQNGASNGQGVPSMEQGQNGQGNGNGMNGGGQEGKAPSQQQSQQSQNQQDHQAKSPPILTDPSVPIPIPQQPIAKRNYASKECGAKVLLTNEEAEHKNAVLNDKERDEYMRNPCEKAQNKFLIIELCETIQPNFLEIANFELFSSGPKDIRLSISERYPAVEWTQIGQIVAADTREMQAFHFNSPGIYAKFIKIDLLSHYGSEHYCTLTTVRVSGISMVDEYEASIDGAIVNSQPDPPQSTETIQNEQQKVVKTVEIPAVTPPQVETEQQKTDPLNESEKAAKKPFGLNKVVDIVGNLGQIKDVIGKTFLGKHGEQLKGVRIHPNSCSHFSPINDEQCHLKCYYFNLIDLPLKKFQFSEKEPKKVFTASSKTNGQQNFLTTILKLAQCPTVASEPKQKVEEEKLSEEMVKERNDVPVKVEQKVEEVKNGQQQEVKNGQQQQVVQNGHQQSGHNGQQTNQNGQQKQTIQNIQQQQTIQNGQQQQANQNGQQNQQVPKVPQLNSLPGTVSTHKESVIMKLNKRLTALELNISLSSEYLSELSRRYVAQQDGYNKQHERDVKVLEEMVSKLGDNLKNGWSEEINQLRSDIKELHEEMDHIKQMARHIPSSNYDPRSGSSLTLLDHSDIPLRDSCYNMLPPAEQIETDHVPNHESIWTNDQIIAVITLSNLSVFILLACVYLLYKIFSRRQRFHAGEMSQQEIRALVQRELDKLKFDKEFVNLNNDIQLKEMENEKVVMNRNINGFIPSSKRSKRNQQKHRYQNGLQSVASSTLSIPSTVATTSTSALDTMSSSPSLSDIDQDDSKKSTVPLIMDLLNDQEALNCDSNQRSASANLPLGVKTEFQDFGSIQTHQLSPPWQTVQNKRKLSDKSLKVPATPQRNGGTKIKVN